MAVHNIYSATQNRISPSFDKNLVKPIQNQQNFADFLKKSIEEVNTSQKNSDMLTEKLVRGENVDLHQVMIASQKASITMQTTMEVRNKVVEAYQEIMRMPM
ncbi:flagellar hook-basal body complex protein FliE [Rossellomorea vietnamensis]|uniref:Flagellar hook-basal body complex protein FliE n=1 Tax=Rossellomorea vietnamensis TaxID=218284 RepID=A0A5D4NS41_9BACI|nr:flagellar hook-basal body complex protein FliE [Rossellomorea vietnamensis]TYS16288.1 flagellar hook-basal body complex protein FliE [Rossellomorea vietnamensis]